MSFLYQIAFCNQDSNIRERKLGSDLPSADVLLYSLVLKEAFREDGIEKKIIFVPPCTRKPHSANDVLHLLRFGFQVLLSTNEIAVYY